MHKITKYLVGNIVCLSSFGPGGTYCGPVEDLGHRFRKRSSPRSAAGRRHHGYRTGMGEGRA